MTASAATLLPLRAEAEGHTDTELGRGRGSDGDLDLAGGDVSLGARKVDKAANLSDLADLQAATDNLVYQQPGVGGLERGVGSALRGLPVSPFGYGAIGDGTTNDRPALQAALTYAASVRRPVDLGGHTYVVDDVLTLFSGSVIAGPGTIIQSTPGKGVFRGIDLSNVVIRDLTLVGPGASHVIDRDGANGAITLQGGSDTLVQNVSVSAFFSGITQTGGTRRRVMDCTIFDFTLYGVVLSKTDGFWINRNSIGPCAQRGAANAYGVSATGDSARQDGQSDNFICDNQIFGIPSWDGVMSHEVSRLICTGNIIRDVRCGFDISAASAGNRLSDIVIANNIIQLTAANTWGGRLAQHAAIYVGGVSGAVIDGVSITGNMIAGPNKIPLGGSSRYAGNLVGAISLQYVVNAQVALNIIRDIGRVGGYCAIAVFSPGNNIRVESNTAQGAWNKGYMVRFEHENVHASCSNVYVRDNACDGLPDAHTLFKTGSYNHVVLSGNTSSVEPLVMDLATVSRSI